MTLPAIILLPLCAGVAGALALGRPGRLAPMLWCLAVTGSALVLLFGTAGDVLSGTPAAFSQPWIPAIGLNLSFRVDGLSLLFALLILGIGLLIVLYAYYYLSDETSLGRFYACLMLFMAAMLGIVLSDNLLLLVVFWELTSLSSFLLVGYWGERAESRQGARMALTVTGLGGLALLAGALLLGSVAGTFEISELLERGDQIRAHALYPAALTLVLLGAFTKSAQFPFHFWLPEAMAAPTPVSAYLHSATMVKAGLFLVARLHPALGGTPLFEYFVTLAGLATLCFAAYVAIFRHDLKGLLAYSTVSHLGLVMFLLGLDTPLAKFAALLHVVNHALFKASLFMAAGIVDHETGTRDMRRLGGLYALMPWTATLAAVAAASMAGVPPLNGFLSKEMFFTEALQAGHLGLLGTVAPWAVTLAGACSVAYSTRFVHDVFLKPRAQELPRMPHEPPRWMRAPVELLVAGCLVVGFMPNLTVQPLVSAAAGATLGSTFPEYSISHWHGFNLPLLMSVLALAVGIALYALLMRDRRLHRDVPAGWAGRLLFTRAMDGLERSAAVLDAALANGSLQRYTALLVVAAVALGAAPLLVEGPPLTGTRPLTPVDGASLVLWCVLIAGAISVVALHRQRLTAVIVVGVVGLVVSLGFLHFSAPDLALTQISVEVVTTALLLMALALLPPESPRESSPGRRSRDAMIAIAAGGGVGVLAWAAMTRPLETLSWFYLERSLPEGGGSNVVNVILVDFRGFDTLGEITVLGIAAIGVLALLDGMRALRAQHAPSGRTWARERFPLMLSAAVRIMLPLALLVAFYIFMRGHNQPGGGFIAGLVTAVALLAVYMADGEASSSRRLGLDWPRLIGAGLGIAGLTGVGSFFFSAPFLTSASGHPVLPLLGEVPLASAMAFDLGVYATVVGASLLTLVSLARVTQRNPAEGGP